jgi:hypothetical protein
MLKGLLIDFHPKSEHLGRRRDDQFGLAQGRQIDHKDAIGILAGAQAGHLEGQAGLTDTTRSNDGQESRREQQLLKASKLPQSSDEARWRQR